MNYPQHILNYVLDIIFPIRCIGCGHFSPKNKKEYICKSCLRLISIKKDLECIGCKRRSVLGKTCIECIGLNSIDNLFVISDYKNPILEKAIKALKYRFVSQVAESFGPLFKKYIGWLVKDKNFNILSDPRSAGGFGEASNPVIIPIPLNPRRLNWRGFNQAEIIADTVADILHLDIRKNILSRPKYSKPQAEIKNKNERLRNLDNKFRIMPGRNIEGKTVILIDDICTTGTTLNEAAMVLKNQGAKKVIGLVVARG